MKKKVLSLALTLALVLALAPAMPAAAATPGTYNPGDIAIINAIIANNGLDLPPAPLDGSSVPAEWDDILSWSEASPDMRVTGLNFTSRDLTGKLYASGLTGLTNFYCGNNNLSALDVSNNPALQILFCHDNQLTSLDVSGAVALEWFNCNGNRLSILDVSTNTALTNLDCGGNLLTTLNVSGASALKYLECGANNLSALDISKNSALTSLSCAGNFLTTLNVSGASALEGLYCGYNNLSTLDVSKNTALKHLYCGGNLFAAVNTDNNPHLTNFSIEGDRTIFDHNFAVYSSKRTDKAALDYYRQHNADKEIIDLANSIVKDLTSDYDKVYEIYVWVASNIWYDYDVAEGRVPWRSTSASNTLQDRRSVCDGYARLTRELLQAAGISAKYISGMAYGESHAWNEAFADGRWVILDSTWGSRNRYAHGEYSSQMPHNNHNFDIRVYWGLGTHRYDDYSEDYLPPPPPNPLNSASTWAREGITAALDKGFVPADIQGNYKNDITRQEFCRMAVKWVEYATGKSIDTILTEQGKTRDPNAFTDTSDPDILAAFALGITAGTGGGRFTPNGQFDRQSAATMIMNTCRAIGADVTNPPTSDFADLNTAATWAQTGINYVRANGIMSGDGTNFNPAQLYTREQSIITFNNIRHNELP